MKHSVPEIAAPHFNRVLVIGLMGLGITLAVLLAWRLKPGLAGSGTQSVLAAAPDSPEAFGEVQPFRLTERSGAEVTLETLRGRPWIASFVFTRCSGPCPRVSGSMKQLQRMLAGTDVRLVTFTVDPQYDTPAVLREYARLLDADAERWLFLTGPPEALMDVSEKSFQLPVERDELQPPGQLVTHKTLLTVVDRTGRIRGYYDGETDAGVQQAAARADFLSQAH
jgi:cytochrome oxidase Cu insertion factor (SCO1/SenC/PrrC family)